MPGGLLTDLYELNMAASYVRRGMNAPATFSLYVRSLPPERGFLVASGVESCVAYLERLSFDDDELEALVRIGYDDGALDAFRSIRFDGEVWAVPEGRVVYANEPLLEVTAPLPVAQLAETYLLNAVTMHTTLASKAARYVLAADGRRLVDFAMRRTHGIEAAEAVARTTAIVGFAATSNVDAAVRLGLDPAGTMAHSYVEAFASERDAFLAFSQDIPARAVFLVDTYDVMRGVATAIEVIRERGLTENLGVRIDSGDLGGLAKGARALLDEAGLESVRIFVSGGLDEREVAQLVAAGTPVDAFGVGTQLGVSYDAPNLESVYKMVRYDGRPVVKLSSGKATLPGEKQVFRGPFGDVLGLREEELPGAPLLEPVMRSGLRVGEPGTIAQARERFEADLVTVPPDARDLEAPTPRVAKISEALRALSSKAASEARRKSTGP